MPKIEQLLEVLKLDPEDPVTHFSLARAYASTGHQEEALEDYGLAVTLKPDHSAAWFEWARLAEQLGLRKIAADAYEGARTASGSTGDDHILKAASVRLERLRRGSDGSGSPGAPRRRAPLDPNVPYAYIRTGRPIVHAACCASVLTG